MDNTKLTSDDIYLHLNKILKQKLQDHNIYLYLDKISKQKLEDHNIYQAILEKITNIFLLVENAQKEHKVHNFDYIERRLCFELGDKLFMYVTIFMKVSLTMVILLSFQMEVNIFTTINVNVKYVKNAIQDE